MAPTSSALSVSPSPTPHLFPAVFRTKQAQQASLRLRAERQAHSARTARTAAVLLVWRC